MFRDIPLPERDLTNSQDLRKMGVADDLGGNKFELKQNVKVRNAGVKLEVPAGCTAIFPAGEDPVLSITRVAPDRLPVPMPPGLSSSLFVTYQPGGTEIVCDSATGRSPKVCCEGRPVRAPFPTCYQRRRASFCWR